MVNTIFLIGAPCVGKTTVGLQLQEQFGFKLIQMSEILNANGGDPIPSHISYNILKEKLSGLGSKEIAIIDGYPNTMESVLQWGVCEYAPICVILFESHSQNLNIRRNEKLKLTTRGDIENIEKREALFTKYITDIVNLYLDMEIKKEIEFFFNPLCNGAINIKTENKSAVNEDYLDTQNIPKGAFKYDITP